jgi:hypothetical protein
MPMPAFDHVSLERLEVRSTTERATFRLSLARSTRSRFVAFDLTPSQAMILMRTLQANQRRHRWAIPMIPAVERLHREDD